MITTKPLNGANSAVQSISMPAKKKIGDRRIVPAMSTQQDATPTSQGLMSSGQPSRMNAATSTSQSNTAAPDFSKVSSPYANTKAAPAPTSLPTQRYKAEDGQVSEDGLVENRMKGLMSLDNKLMQKSIVNANNLSASRGLQSSSIATENAVNSMYNYALPIAQQDAQTVSQQNFINQDKRQQLGLEDNRALNQQGLNDAQNRFTATENQVQRDFSVEIEALRQQNNLGLLSAEQQGRLKELEADQAFRAGESNKDRTLTVELEELRQQNNLGLLSAEQQGRLVELEKQNEFADKQLEKSSQLQTQRDRLLQSFSQDNMATDLANQLVAMEAQAKSNIEIQNNQNNFARQMEYSNAISSAVNFGIEALGNAMMNPEITPDQYASISANINAMVQGQITNYQDIYAINPAPPEGDNIPRVNDPSPVNPLIPKPNLPPPNISQPAIGGGSGGLIGRGRNPNLREQ